MAGLFSRLKTWAKGENLKSADLNAEFNNMISNIGPNLMSGDSANVAQMQTQVNPGSQGSESLAQTTSDEIERLRYVLSRIIGQSFWYDTPALSIAEVNTLISQGNFTPPPNRIVSGKMRASSNQSAFLVANGSNANVQLKGAATPFLYRIAGTQYTISSDVTLTFGSFAPSSNNTCLVNDAALVGQTSSKVQGEGSSVLTVDAMGTNITALIGTFAAFKTSTEYFIGFVNSSTQITKCFRGFFFDSSYAPLARVTLLDNDTITLQKLFWVFGTTGGALDSAATNPKVSFATPASPATGDYWFDLGNSVWKKYNGSSFVTANATLVGLAVVGTANCVASRAFEFYAPYDGLDTFALEIQDNNTLRTKAAGMVANVAGNLINYQKALVSWIKPDNFDSGITDGANKVFYAYLKDTGDVTLSDTAPYDRSADLRGKYHPHNPWRSLAAVTNDGSSHFISITQETVPDADSLARQMTSVGANFIANTVSRLTQTPGTSGNILKTTSSGAFTNVNTSYTNVTNLSGDLTTTGKPVKIYLVPDGSAPAFIGVSATSGLATQSIFGRIQVTRNGSSIGEFEFGTVLQVTSGTLASGIGVEYPPASVCFIDDNAGAGLAAGTYTYNMQSLATGSSLNCTMSVKNCRMIAEEMR